MTRGLLQVALVLSLVLSTSCSGRRGDTPPDAYRVKRGDTLYSIAWRHGLDHKQLARWNRLENENLIYPGQVLTLKPAGVPRRSKASSATRVLDSGQTWVWPTNGRVLSTFSQGGSVASKGIDIAGRSGQPIRAAAPGRVVYSGSGLLGYGQLIIVKHSDTYLSAYGHSDELLVQEGDSVKAGERIAKMGVGPEKRPMLHFEIRLNGKPVDPLRYLPAQ